MTSNNFQISAPLFLFCPLLNKIVRKSSAPSFDAGGKFKHAGLSQRGGTLIEPLPRNHQKLQVSFLSLLSSHFQTFLEAFPMLPRKPVRWRITFFLTSSFVCVVSPISTSARNLRWRNLCYVCRVTTKDPAMPNFLERYCVLLHL